MAARINRNHKREVRERIQTSQLLNRLQSNALGKLKKPLEPGEIRSIEILLRKSLPDLSQVEHTGTPLEPLTEDPVSIRQQARAIYSLLREAAVPKRSN